MATKTFEQDGNLIAHGDTYVIRIKKKHVTESLKQFTNRKLEMEITLKTKE